MTERKKRITVELPESVVKRLRAYAKHDGMEFDEHIVWILSDYAPADFYDPEEDE